MFTLKAWSEVSKWICITIHGSSKGLMKCRSWIKHWCKRWIMKVLHNNMKAAYTWSQFDAVKYKAKYNTGVHRQSYIWMSFDNYATFPVGVGYFQILQLCMHYFQEITALCNEHYPTRHRPVQLTIAIQHTLCNAACHNSCQFSQQSHWSCKLQLCADSNYQLNRTLL